MLSVASSSSTAAAAERNGDWVAADKAYGTAFDEAIGRGDLIEVVAILRKSSNVRLRLEGPEEALELAELSYEIAVRIGHSASAARGLNVMAVIHHSSGNLDLAEPLYRRALDLALEADDPETVGMICQNLGVVANVRGDLRAARLLYLESIGSAIRSGSRMASTTAYNNLGMVCCDLSEWMEAEIYFGRGIEIAEQIGDVDMLGRLLGNHVETLIQSGEYGQALKSLDRAEEIATHVNDSRGLADGARYRARLARLEKDFQRAEELLRKSLSIAEGEGLRLEVGEALEEHANLRWAEGRAGPARVLLRRAIEVFEELGASNDIERSRRTLARWAPELVPRTG